MIFGWNWMKQNPLKYLFWFLCLNDFFLKNIWNVKVKSLRNVEKEYISFNLPIHFFWLWIWEKNEFEWEFQMICLFFGDFLFLFCFIEKNHPTPHPLHIFFLFFALKQLLISLPFSTKHSPSPSHTLLLITSPFRFSFPLMQYLSMPRS